MATKKKLIIVESPNKVATIKNIVGPDFTVMASVGHITEIKDGGPYRNTGIDPSNKFKTNYVISTSKKEVVKKLKEAVEKADEVYLATDPDREGEAISWHLKNQLKIASKYKRITFHEITKSAVLAALTNPRKIDDDLVNAAQSRAIIDKITGYSLSPIARDSIGAKSVGRCQSAGLKLIVEREDEIQNFKSEKYFDLYLHFYKNQQEFKAKYMGTTKKEIKRITDLETIRNIKKDCEGHDYLISNINSKEIKESPKPPFTTSTFQQEANKVYNMSIDSAMSCAQKLFEGINLMGEHVALITYIRTDDCSMAPEFQDTLSKYIVGRFGKEYLGKLQQGKKSESAQEAHECLRVVDLMMTPDKLKTHISDYNLLKIYKLIYLRTVQSMMSPALLNDTQYDIVNSDHLFTMHSREVIFDGYRRVYSDDDSLKDDVIKETFEVNEKLQDTSLVEELKETTPPPRYTEATFIKELDKRGIGRPSTYASIVKTLLDESRGYCRVENKFIVPTVKGMNLSKFLNSSFPDFINLNYTRDLEQNLDLIANGKLDYLDFLNQFYEQIEASIKNVVPEQRVCPECGAKLIKRKSKYGMFWGCSNYPNCKHIEK